MTEPVSIRFNNPGAINAVPWVRQYPGYDSETETTTGNRTARMRTAEDGVALYWDLLYRYRGNGYKTVSQIINKYGGGQNYSKYVDMVEKWTGFHRNKEIDIYDDEVLLPFAKAMFRYEAGKQTPLSDAEIIK